MATNPTPSILPENPLGLPNPNIFSEQPEKASILANIPTIPEALPEVKTSTPTLTSVAGMAALSDHTDGISSEMDLIQRMRQTTDMAKQLLDQQQESALRYQSAARQILLKDKGIKSIPSMPGVDPRLVQQVEAARRQNFASDMEKTAKTALEDEAVGNIRTLMTAGNETEARIVLQSLTPGKSSSTEVLHENAVKQMLLSEMADKFNLANKDESWIHWGLSTLLSIPDSILLGNSFSVLGNVPQGTNGYEGSFFRLFQPGSDLRKQVQAIRGMSSSELADALPELIKNIQQNSNELFVIHDPGRAAELAKPFAEGGETPNETFMRNVWGIADPAFLIPFSSAGKLATLPGLLASSGSRRAAAAVVSDAVDTAIRSGSEKMTEKSGMTVAQLEDHVLPTIVNPNAPLGGLDLKTRLKSGTYLGTKKEITLPSEGPLVSLSGDVNNGIEAANQTLELLKIPLTGREHSAEELAGIIEHTEKLLKERTGGVVQDIAHKVETLPDGTVAHYLEATIGNPEGGGFASMEELHGYMKQFGGFHLSEVIPQEIETRVRTTPRDEGYDFQVYHGTTKDFDVGEINSSPDGWLGPGVYVTPDPEYSRVYSMGEYPSKVDPTKIVYRSPSYEGARTIPLLIDKSKLFGEAQVLGWTKEDAFNAIKELKPSAEFKKWVKSWFEVEGNGSIPSQVFYDHLVIGKEAREGLSVKLQKLGYHGISALTDGHEIVIFDPKNVRSALEAHVKVDISRQYFGKVRLNVRESGLFTPLENVPRTGFLGKIVNASIGLHTRLFEQASRAGQKRNRLYNIIQNNLVKAFRPLSSAEHRNLSQILIEGDKHSVWFTNEQLNTIYERAYGELPSEKVSNAYHQFRLNNDMEFVLRDADMYRQKVLRGFESVYTKAQGQEIDIDAKVTYSPDRLPTKERIYNLSDDEHYTKSSVVGKTITDERMRELRDQGYLIFNSEKPVKLSDGTTVNWFIGKKTDVELRPLRREQLQYKAGGHRLYADKYFVKQAIFGTQGDTLEKFLLNPAVHITAPTLKQAKDWAETMNRARIAVKEGKTEAEIDQYIFQGRAGYPKASEFTDSLKAGDIDPDQPFEAVFDREVPSAYHNVNPDLQNFLDEDEAGFNGFYRTTGKMYYSPKGEALKDYSGDWAPTIDPFIAQSRGLNNVAQMSSFSDFKMSSIDRWVETYKGDLIGKDPNSAYRTFADAKVAETTPLAKKQQIEGQRAIIKRILGFQTEWDRTYRNFMRSTSEFIVGDSSSKLRQWAGKIPFTMLEHNPLNWLRGWAFDSKLGLFNPGQLLLQTSTLFSIMALAPTHALHGMASIMPQLAYTYSKAMGHDSERLLEHLAQAGTHKAAGFADVAEWKAYVREVHSNGFLDLGDTHQLINDFGPVSSFGTMSNAIQKTREMGRFFFYQAEAMNRIVANRVAYAEAVDRFGKEATNTTAFKDFLAGRRENYSFNMSNESKAWWQTGIVSIPTQFFAYNARMLEAMVGKDFTPIQRFKLAAMQLGLMGTAGLPVLDGIADYVEKKHGVKPDINTMWGTIDRGALDRVIYEAFGADVQVGERMATGSFWTQIVKDIFGMNEYTDRSFADISGGATYGIWGKTLGSAIDISKFWMTNEGGNEKVEIEKDKAIELLRQVSTFNNGLKAYMVYQHGQLTSAAGNTLVTGLPKQDAVWIALGMPPEELDRMDVVKSYQSNRKESVTQAATEINNLLTESTIRPDKFIENTRKVNYLMHILPPDIKYDVLKEAHANRDPSIYDRVMRIQDEEEAIKRVQDAAQTNEAQ